MSEEDKKTVEKGSPGTSRDTEKVQTPEQQDKQDQQKKTEKKEQSSGSGQAAAEKKKKTSGRRQNRGRGRRSREDNQYTESVVTINRVAKVVKGGKNFSFNALMVSGDENGNVGIGFGKSNEVVGAIKKAAGKAKENHRSVKLQGDTIPHPVVGRFKSTKVVMKPAGPGTGVIAGGPVRAICDAVGIKNILTKSLGSRNPINVVKATFDGFDQLRLKRRTASK